MRHQHQRAGKFGEAVFQHFERGDVEIVGRLVEQQQVGGLQHQARDQHARLLAAREAGDAAGPTDRHRRGSAWPSRRRGSAGPDR